MNTLEEYEHGIWELKQKVAEEREITIFLSKHKELACDANVLDDPDPTRRGLIRQFLADSEINQETLESAVEALGDQLARKSPSELAKEDVAERENLLMEMIQLGASLDLMQRTHHVGAQDGRKGADPVAARNSILRDPARLIQFPVRMSIEDLRQKVADLRRYQDLQQADHSVHVAEARQEQAAHHPQIVKVLEPLPEHITRKTILQASKEQIQDWQRRHGNDSINARLQGRG
jgi:hypothetical protein